jgi:hypothetical protein
MASHSPWGAIQSREKITEGVCWVSTARHGGLMVTRKAAEKYLSAKAIECAFPGIAGDYICFEEDCSYAVALFEHPEWLRKMEESKLEDWRKYRPASECVPGGWDYQMAKHAEECIPKLIERLARQDSELKTEMEAIVKHWTPQYFGMPTLCGDCRKTPIQGYGFGLCEECKAK